MVGWCSGVAPVRTREKQVFSDKVLQSFHEARPSYAHNKMRKMGTPDNVLQIFHEARTGICALEFRLRTPESK